MPPKLKEEEEEEQVVHKPLHALNERQQKEFKRVEIQRLNGGGDHVRTPSWVKRELRGLLNTCLRVGMKEADEGRGGKPGKAS